MTRANATDLYEQHHLRVFRFFRKMCGSISAAEDLTQELFLRVLRAEGPEDSARPEAWIFTIARNLLRDRWRGGKRQPEIRLLAADEPIPLEPTQQVSAEIDRALQELPETDREVFLLREIAGCGYAEIGAMTELTPDAVRSRIHRSRLALRESLKQPIRRIRQFPKRRTGETP